MDGCHLASGLLLLSLFMSFELAADERGAEEMD
jgi:hypothetical protein